MMMMAGRNNAVPLAAARARRRPAPGCSSRPGRRAAPRRFGSPARGGGAIRCAAGRCGPRGSRPRRGGSSRARLASKMPRREDEDEASRRAACRGSGIRSGRCAATAARATASLLGRALRRRCPTVGQWEPASHEARGKEKKNIAHPRPKLLHAAPLGPDPEARVQHDCARDDVLRQPEQDPRCLGEEGAAVADRGFERGGDAI